MSGEQALLAAIRDNPDDDTVRLAYADWLDEQEVTYTQCPVMGCGVNAKRGHIRVNSGRNYRWGEPREKPCPKCNGAAEVIDTATRDRAEFIRVQCSIAHPDWSPLGRTGDLFRRNELFVTRHYKRWTRVACPECRGTGDSDGQSRCSACAGTGNAMRLHMAEFCRGFVDQIRNFELFDLLAGATAGVWAATPKSLAIVRAHPLVQRIHLIDRIPAASSGGTGEWYRDNGRGRVGETTYHLPDPIFDALRGPSIVTACRVNSDVPAGWCKAYESADLACLMLAEAVAAVLHDFAKGQP